MSQAHDELLELWDALPAYTREWLQSLIARDLPHTSDAVLVDVDVAPNDDDPDGSMLAIIELSTGHLYGASFLPRPAGARLH